MTHIIQTYIQTKEEVDEDNVYLKQPNGHYGLLAHNSETATRLNFVWNTCCLPRLRLAKTQPMPSPVRKQNIPLNVKGLLNLVVE